MNIVFKVNNPYFQFLFSDLECKYKYFLAKFLFKPSLYVIEFKSI